MIRQIYQIEIITPCFCGGAEPEKQAEIRPASIRGQLRWWFRVLGGFKSLAPMSVREQERLIFGSTAGDEGTAGLLTVRVSGLAPSRVSVDDERMDARPGSAKGYLLFPLRPEKKGKPGERRRDRAVFNEKASGHGGPSFELQLLWRGNPSVGRSLEALASLFANLGSLGFRSRRAMGALAAANLSIPLAEALTFFCDPSGVSILFLDVANPENAISQLAKWLRSWRAHGRSGQNAEEQQYPGYSWAKKDHDTAIRNSTEPGYRAAIGLPLLTKYGNWNAERPPAGKQTSGRFASPVILRPHRDFSGNWRALVIFVDALKWPGNKEVYLNGMAREVSLDLYNAMKVDRRLQPFP